LARKFKMRSRTLVVFCLLALASIWLGVKWRPFHPPRDFEECSENAETMASSGDERASLIIECAARFAGRRKAGEGYTYYDFMQNQHFDIVGPNPSPEELKQIDRQYTIYLDVQRQNAIAEALAKKQSEQIQADLEKAQRAGPPMVITQRTYRQRPPKSQPIARRLSVATTAHYRAAGQSFPGQ
jgi:hypothetical protein